MRVLHLSVFTPVEDTHPAPSASEITPFPDTLPLRSPLARILGSPAERPEASSGRCRAARRGVARSPQGGPAAPPPL